VANPVLSYRSDVWTVITYNRKTEVAEIHFLRPVAGVPFRVKKPDSTDNYKLITLQIHTGPISAPTGKK
jgi:hypothetical protein